jgi:hypothetical protein
MYMHSGLLQVCEHHTHCGLSAFPMAMLESVRHMEMDFARLKKSDNFVSSQETWTPAPVLKPCHLGTPESHVNAVFKRTWIWHFRNSCDHKPTDGMTGVEQARRKVDAILMQNLKDGNGRVLPGA